MSFSLDISPFTPPVNPLKFKKLPCEAVGKKVLVKVNEQDECVHCSLWINGCPVAYALRNGWSRKQMHLNRVYPDKCLVNRK